MLDKLIYHKDVKVLFDNQECFKIENVHLTKATD